MTGYGTIDLTVDAGVCTITLDRPKRLNAFNQEMLDDFGRAWAVVREDDAVRVVVLQANGDRAFSSGLDRTDGIAKSEDPWPRRLPSGQLGPKSNAVFKPVICAVHGICAGGAFYWISESDIVICSEDAEFFDPHVSYGQVSPVVTWSLRHQVPHGVALRMSLMGLDERLGASSALAVGLVSEVLPRPRLRDRARELADRIAAKPPAAVRGTVKAAWDSLAASRGDHEQRATMYSAIGNPLSRGEGIAFRDGDRPKPEIR